MQLSKMKYEEQYNKTNCHEITMKTSMPYKVNFVTSTYLQLNFHYINVPIFKLCLSLIVTVMSLNLMYCGSFPYEE